MGLKEIRKSKGLTINELALKTNYSRCGDLEHMRLSILRIETGKIVCPRPRKTYEYKEIARVLECDIKDIYREEGK